MVLVVISLQFEIEITFQYESAREVDHTFRRDEASPYVLSRFIFPDFFVPWTLSHINDVSPYILSLPSRL